MELSNEDSLRLNVLLANAEAVRIDENAMLVYGLAGEQEMKVPLNPNCRADKYVQAVREMLSGQVLGSPGGYPVFLRRWTRMGQINTEDLDKLLMLGEPEAVVAVSGSRALTDELARRAWWIAPYPEHARRMLQNPNVVGGQMGPVLAEFLVEHLPFETEHQAMLETVRLVLQPGLISEETLERLWQSGRNKKTYRIGFLETLADDLPETQPARADLEAHRARLEALAADNPFAHHLLRLLDVPGQSFLEVAADIMRRPADQDVVSALLNAIGNFVGELRQEQGQLREMEEVLAVAERLCEDGRCTPVAELLEALPELTAEVRAMLVLAHIDEAVAIPIFSRSDAVGSLMRKKIEPITAPLREQFAVLRGQRD